MKTVTIEITDGAETTFKAILKIEPEEWMSNADVGYEILDIARSHSDGLIWEEWKDNAEECYMFGRAPKEKK